MPELPEVETLRRGLSKKIKGQKISQIEVINSKTFYGDPRLIENKKVLNIWRRAKVLGMDLSNNLSLLFHLKMTGQLIYDDGKRKLIGGHPTKDMRDEMPNRSTRVIFSFSDKSILFFNDQRKFGWIKLMYTDLVKEEKLLKILGPEPLDKDFSWLILKKNLLRHRSMAIKVALLDQSVVSGIGNIYASEACFNAKLDPKIRISKMTDAQFKAIHQGIIMALKNGIDKGGSSKTHFVNDEGKKGRFLQFAFVYSRKGEKCRVCGNEIDKLQLGGRGTFYCPNCQKS